MSCEKLEKRLLGRWTKHQAVYQIKAMYSGNVRFEISVDVGGRNYLVILGEHVNGLFCCIPNRGISCEMTDPRDTYHNAKKLLFCDIPGTHAEALADAICKTAVAMYDFLAD